MSRLLLIRPVDGRVEILLADTEAWQGRLRVFSRGTDVVLSLGCDEPIVVRDIRGRSQSSQLLALPKQC